MASEIVEEIKKQRQKTYSETMLELSKSSNSFLQDLLLEQMVTNEELTTTQKSTEDYFFGLEKTIESSTKKLVDAFSNSKDKAIQVEYKVLDNKPLEKSKPVDSISPYVSMPEENKAATNVPASIENKPIVQQPIAQNNPVVDPYTGAITQVASAPAQDPNYDPYSLIPYTEPTTPVAQNIDTGASMLPDISKSNEAVISLLEDIEANTFDISEYYSGLQDVPAQSQSTLPEDTGKQTDSGGLIGNIRGGLNGAIGKVGFGMAAYGAVENVYKMLTGDSVKIMEDMNKKFDEQTIVENMLSPIDSLTVLGDKLVKAIADNPYVKKISSFLGISTDVSEEDIANSESMKKTQENIAKRRKEAMLNPEFVKRQEEKKKKEHEALLNPAASNIEAPVIPIAPIVEKTATDQIINKKEKKKAAPIIKNDAMSANFNENDVVVGETFINRTGLPDSQVSQDVSSNPVPDEVTYGLKRDKFNKVIRKSNKGEPKDMNTSATGLSKDRMDNAAKEKPAQVITVSAPAPKEKKDKSISRKLEVGDIHLAVMNSNMLD